MVTGLVGVSGLFSVGWLKSHSFTGYRGEGVLPFCGPISPLRGPFGASKRVGLEGSHVHSMRRVWVILCKLAGHSDLVFEKGARILPQ